MNKNIFNFDYASSTPLDSRVLDEMVKCMSSENYAINPSASKSSTVDEWIDLARTRVSKTIKALPHEIIWTSGATESNNLAIIGACQFYRMSGDTILVVETEHSSVIKSANHLLSLGFKVKYIPVIEDGTIDINFLSRIDTQDVLMLCCQHVNNETGVIQPITSLSQWCRSKGILFHVDAAQSVGKLAVDVSQIKCDFMSLSAHKLFGPKGIGALYIASKPQRRLKSLSFGGFQENGLRAGTLPTHQIVGMGKAYELVDELLLNRSVITHARHMLDELKKRYDVIIFGENNKVPHILSVCFKSFSIDQVHEIKNRVICSTASACQESQGKKSHVLKAMGVHEDKIMKTLRLSISKYTTKSDVDHLLEIIRSIASH